MIDLIKSLRLGTMRGHAFGKPFTLSISAFSTGKAIKIVAHELGGPGYISANLYELNAGWRLFPCEMSSSKVIGFLREFAFEPHAQHS